MFTVTLIDKWLIRFTDQVICLQNHILDFMKYSDHWRGTSATIVPKDNASIWGAIWRVHNKDMAALDKFVFIIYLLNCYFRFK